MSETNKLVLAVAMCPFRQGPPQSEASKEPSPEPSPEPTPEPTPEPATYDKMWQTMADVAKKG